MKCAVVIAVLLSATGLAAAQDVSVCSQSRAKPRHAARSARAARPLPVVIPQQFAPPQEAYASLPDNRRGRGARQRRPPARCALAKIAEFKPLPVLVGAGECGATDAVLMDTVILPDQSKVAVMPPATMRCPMAEADRELGA